MNKITGRGMRVALAAGAIASLAGVANAGLSEIVLEVHAEVNGQVGIFSVPQSAGTWSGSSYNWTLANPVTILSSTGLPLGILTNASVAVIEDPVVSVNFNIASTALNTAFTISSPLLSFPAMTNAEGAASAALSITDLGGDGVTLTPMGAGAYTSNYNGLVPGGSPFANLLGAPVVAGPFSTTVVSQEFPGGGLYVPIAGSVSDISARWQFTLSPDDLASGTGVFTVVPAPSALGLLALGGLVGGRRRR